MQNKITRSCALSFVVGFSLVYSREAAVEASAASGIGGCMGQRIPGYGRPAAV